MGCAGWGVVAKGECGDESWYGCPILLLLQGKSCWSNACAEKNTPILSLACDPGSQIVVAGTELEAYQATVALWLVATSCHSDVLMS